MTAKPVVIGGRFRGPPQSGNGGYVCGLVAGALGGSGCTVTLKRPPPLDRTLELRSSDGEATLVDGEEVIASAVRAELELDIPAAPSLERAREAEARYVGHHRHRFPGCFVCGPERAVGDGMRIFPGAVAEGRVASTWTPTDEGNAVAPQLLWAALDCPGYFAVEEAAGLALLGRMTARIEAAVAVGEPLIVSGWSIGGEGRKHHVGTAVHRPEGSLVAAARSTWISIAV